MNPGVIQNRSLIDFGVATRPLAGQTVSGDLHLVTPINHGVLLATVDGVGHGEEATVAAQMAVAILEKHAQESVISLVKRCHEVLTKTRGVVMTLASLNAVENTITWLGVGNVEGLLLRADANATHPSEGVLLRGGLVGYQLPTLQANVIPVAPGDLLVFATDGIRDDFPEGLTPTESPQQIADRILNRYLKGNDDALVLVARFLGIKNE
jgi:serine phosphatase RsbU (regulator of sigma subunit)